VVKKVLLGVAALIALLVIVIATRPARFRIERSARIDAPADIVFAQVNDSTTGTPGHHGNRSTRA
jgi:hypothetical protein